MRCDLKDRRTLSMWTIAALQSGTCTRFRPPSKHSLSKGNGGHGIMGDIMTKPMLVSRRMPLTTSVSRSVQQTSAPFVVHALLCRSLCGSLLFNNVDDKYDPYLAMTMIR